MSARAIGGKQMYWNNACCSGNTKLARYRPVQITDAQTPSADRNLGIYRDLKNK
jgi:hypothetical protein